jgi:hypothetical protein
MGDADPRRATSARRRDGRARETPDPGAVERALIRLADDRDAPDAAVARRASAAATDLDAAATFVDRVGLPRLRRAVARLERDGRDPDGTLDRRVREARAALRAFERYRRAADGHFHSGHDTDLGAGAERSSR